MAFLEIRHPQNELRTNLEAVRPADGETWIRLPAKAVSFGRGTPRAPEDAHVQIVGEDTMSRRHFSIGWGGGDFLLADEGSAGGTYVNDGERADRRPLRDGDVIHLGAPSRSGKVIFRTVSTPRPIALPVLAKAWIELWDSGDLEAFDLLHAHDFVDRAASGRPTDRDGFRAGLLAWRGAFPDLRVMADDIIAAADRDLATVRWNAHGTHRAVYLGVPPTNRIIWFRGIEIIRFTADRVVERWGEWDGLDLLSQLRGAAAMS